MAQPLLIVLGAMTRGALDRASEITCGEGETD
jgi:hypothetical protein